MLVARVLVTLFQKELLLAMVHCNNSFHQLDRSPSPE
uniref:Uncharacterized protein n=1 Tax=Utricularia reniformis TaxID=192314 RepID=A0A1Y0B3Q3_9LAMI|nr:hypothetical protein AEK19_MT1786 [Utricularia reniformis]ART31959.1 hypothetical protein AEK19_MT1786 [Utricularia reniformis]